MRWLVSTSLELRFLVIALAAVLMVWGIRTLPDSRLDVFPEFAPPLVEIQTECPGLTTKEVESLISVPLESALSGVSWLETMRSKSVSGLSSVVLHFERGTDLMRARQLVQERIATVSPQLPLVALPPVILSPLSATSRALKIGLSSKKVPLIELSTLARWTIRPRLMAIPGVANVAIWGQRDRELQILVDPEHLRGAGVALNDVIRAAGDATRPAAGGFIDTPNQRLGVAHRPAILSAEDLGRVAIRREGEGTLTLKDVALVTEGHPPLIGDGVINEGPGILLIVEKQPWGNTLDVTLEVEKVLDALRPGLEGIEIDSTIFRPATFIERSIENLGQALLIGCLLVVVILAAFLWEWRTALISTIAIPVSLMTAAMILHALGQTINTMVLAGLIIALGEVVDDAIIDVENIVRRLRLERNSPEPRSIFEVVLSASFEVRSAIVYATLIVVLALLPVFFMQGLSGSFFRPLALSYALAVIASMVVALTLTPALSVLLFEHGQQERESPLIIWLKVRYRAWLPSFLRHGNRALGSAMALSLSALVLFPFLGEGFLPDFKETDFLMHWVAKPGTSLPEMRRITIQASQELRAIEGVRNFGAHIGRAEVADEVVGINFTELWISIDEDVDYDRTLAKVQEVVDGYPGLYRDVLTYLRERIKEVLTGASTSIVVRIYGEDLEVLRAQAQRLRAAISDVEGVTDLKVEQLVAIPQIEIRPKLDALAAFGLTPGDIRRAITTLIRGTKVGEIYDAQKVFNVVVRGAPAVRRTFEGLDDLVFDAPGGAQVQLKDVASVRIVSAPNMIKRESASRRIDVGCNVKGRDLGSVANEIKARLFKLDFPRGYHPEVLGEYKARQDSQQTLIALGGIALLGVFLLLQAAFGSWRLATMVFITLPAALVGGVIAVAISGGVLSLGSLVGFVTVLGIAARNGIMLISHYQHLEREERVPFSTDLILRGAEERLAPILMTALTTGLALLPLIISGDQPGHEIEHPMAVVILGGLLTSCLMNLFVVPVFYQRFAEKVSAHDPSS